MKLHVYIDIDNFLPIQSICVFEIIVVLYRGNFNFSIKRPMQSYKYA